MSKYFATDIKNKKVFKRIGCTYYQVYADTINNIYVYDMVKDGEHRGYEIVKGIKYKNPDGSICYRFPSDEEFGVYAWSTIGTENTFDVEMEQLISRAKIIENRANLQRNKA